jgi:hypothetical protein
MRNIAATLSGIIAGVFFIGFIQWVGNTLFPANLPLPEKKSEWSTYMAYVPFMAKLSVIVSYAIAGFIAAMVASFIQGRTLYRPALVATGILQLLAWLNMMSFPHPAWMWISGSLVFLPMGYFAYRFFRKEEMKL